MTADVYLTAGLWISLALAASLISIRIGISVALLDRFDTSLVVSLYVVAVLAVTTACVLAAPETSQTDLHADPVDQRAGNR
jgi:hypothetical protein